MTNKMGRRWIGVAWLFTQTNGARIRAHVESAADATTFCRDTDNGLSNSFGDGCAKYGSDFGDTQCGFFDTDQFKSAELCCACGGGTGVCQDLDNGITNTFGDGCSKYGSDFGDTTCGFFDTDTFKSTEMCCVCGGGLFGPSTCGALQCDDGFIRIQHENYGCGGNMCNDEQCCGREAFCEEHTCGVGQLWKGRDGGCRAASCEDWQCCEPEATCGTLQCGYGFIRIQDENYGCGANVCNTEQCCGGANRIQARITDATNLVPVAHAEVAIRQGWLEIWRTTDDNGVFDAEGVPTGEVRVSVTKDGYISAEKTITVAGDIFGAFADISLSPVLPHDGWRVVLTWGQSPADLDSHTYFGDSCHASYSQRHASCSGVTANLDVDDTNGYGPETTTLTHVNSKIVFKVHNYSGSPGWGGSDAVVKLYNGEREVGTFTVNSDGIQSGMWWSVFHIDGSTGEAAVCSTSDCN